MSVRNQSIQSQTKVFPLFALSLALLAVGCGASPDDMESAEFSPSGEAYEDTLSATPSSAWTWNRPRPRTWDAGTATDAGTTTGTTPDAGTSTGTGTTTPDAGTSTGTGTTTPGTGTTTPGTGTTTPGSGTSTGTTAQLVQLPIEVIGSEGFTRSVNVDLSAADAAAPLKFWMQVHSLTYQDKASVSFNGGSWLPLNNNSVTVEGLGKSYGGIGGAFATLKLRLDVPSGALRAGQNQITFRFNVTDERSIGYRVLKLNFLRADGSRVLADSAFVQEDPSTWKPPFTDAASISEGEQLWRTKQLVFSSKNSQTMKARCTDCHAQDGRDLKYFNYSNHAIIERSKFHGLTELEGQKIASYIRSLQGVPTPGQPWNPPYQPGPGLDSKPVEQWAAGAGVDAVLEKDREMLPHLFPNGSFKKEAVATNANLSAREVPIAFQLPDWNHWLPSIHPKDAWGDAFVNNQVNKAYNFEGTATGVAASMRQLAAKVRDSNYQNYREELFYPHRAWSLYLYNFLSPRYSDANTSQDTAHSRKIYSGALWHMVKMWEVMQEFGLESKLQLMFPASRDARGWMANYSFDTSPNMLKLPRENTGINNNSPLMFNYFSMGWYQLALILYNGSHTDGSDRSVMRPIDWGYIPGFIQEMQSLSEEKSPVNGLLTLWLVKGMQSTDNSLKPNAPDSAGWKPSHAGDPSRLVVPQHMPGWADMSQAERKGIMEALLSTWWDKTRQYAAADWQNGGGATTTEVINGWYDGSLGNRIWYMLPQFKYHGVNPTLVDSIADWAQTVWPQANWAEVKSATCAPYDHYVRCTSEKY